MSTVYIIMNEWQDDMGNEYAEVTDAKFFTSEQDAWDALFLIGEANGYQLHPTDTSVTLHYKNDARHVKVDEYYIMELTKG